MSNDKNNGVDKDSSGSFLEQKGLSSANLQSGLNPSPLISEPPASKPPETSAEKSDGNVLSDK